MLREYRSFRINLYVLGVYVLLLMMWISVCKHDGRDISTDMGRNILGGLTQPKSYFLSIILFLKI